jgi:hypothetical protein
MSDAAPINPYEPSLVPLELADGPPDVYCGPWRDGELLVLDSRFTKRLPSRCVLTGVEIGPDERMRREIHYQGNTWSQSSITVNWPVARKARPGWRFCDYVAWGMIVTGTGSALCYAFLTNSSHHDVVPKQVALLGALLAVLGFFLILLYDWRPLSLHRCRGTLTWVNGVHPHFLRHLPPWSEPTNE